MFCSQCGEELTDDAAFCNSCKSATRIKKAANPALQRRSLKLYDIVAIDYDELSAIAAVADASIDPTVTGGISDGRIPAYRFDYLAGATPNRKTKQFESVTGFIWLRDDPDNIYIAGVNGYQLPARFFGLDTRDILNYYGGHF